MQKLTQLSFWRNVTKASKGYVPAASRAALTGNQGPQLTVCLNSGPDSGLVIARGGRAACHEQIIPHETLVNFEAEQPDTVQGNTSAGERLLKFKLAAKVGGHGPIFLLQSNLAILNGQKILVPPHGGDLCIAADAHGRRDVAYDAIMQHGGSPVHKAVAGLHVSLKQDSLKAGDLFRTAVFTFMAWQSFGGGRLRVSSILVRSCKLKARPSNARRRREPVCPNVGLWFLKTFFARSASLPSSMWLG